MRTRLSEWQINGLKGSGEMKYVEAKHITVSHVADDVVTYAIAFPTDIVGVNIKTIRVTSEQSANAFVVTLLDGNTTLPIYESLEEVGFHYDNVDIPYKPADNTFYVKIHNRGTVATKFHIDIRGIEVK